MCGAGCAMFGSQSLAQATQPGQDAADLYVKAGELLAANDAKNIMSPAASNFTYADYPPFPAEWQRMEKEDFAAAMKALAGLRAPVDAFFEGVLVNAEDAALRRNRLLLLSRLREALSAVADFSKIEG